MLVSECSANPYSFRPPDAATSNAAPSAGGEAAEHADLGALGGSSQPALPVRPALPAAADLTQRLRVLGRGAVGGGLLGLAHQIGDLVVADARPGHHARRCAIAAAPDDRDDGEPARDRRRRWW